MADGADLAKYVGDGQKPGASREKVALEIRPQAVTHHRDAHVVRHRGKLPDLRLAEELRLIDHHAGQRRGRVLRRDQRCHIGVAVEHGCRRLEPNPRANPSFTDPVVKPGREKHGVHAALAVIVRRLKKNGRFAGIHRGIGKVKLGHATLRQQTAILPPARRFVNGKNTPPGVSSRDVQRENER